MSRLRWEIDPGRPRPRRPYRDSALFYAILAAVVIVLAVLTGGGLARAVAVAAAFFVVATGWAWLRWRRQEQALARREQNAAGSGEGRA